MLEIGIFCGISIRKYREQVIDFVQDVNECGKNAEAFLNKRVRADSSSVVSWRERGMIYEAGNN